MSQTKAELIKGLNINASAPATALNIDSTGRVGIGTSSPSELLHIAGVTNPGIVLQDTTNNTDARIKTNNNGDLVFEADYNAEAADTRISFEIDGSEKARFDSSGRLGIGTTSPSQLLHVASALTTGGATPVTWSRSGGATGYLLVDGSGAGIYSGGALSDSGIYLVPNDRVSFSVNGSERFRCDSSGRLLVGTSTARSNVYQSALNITPQNQIESNKGDYSGGLGLINCSASGQPAVLTFGQSYTNTLGGNALIANNQFFGLINFTGNDGTNFRTGAQISALVDGTPGANDMPGRLVFSTTADGASSPTERMRISNTGKTTISWSEGEVFGLSVNGNTGNQYNLYLSKSVDQNTVNEDYIRGVGGSTTRFRFVGNGGLYNFQANNTNLSDRNTKKDISPAADTWDCIKEWEIVNYRYKDQPDDADLNLGVIAQQVAESCPEVITIFEQATEDQPEKLGVKEQQMYWMAIKALQEAQVRIEQLETEKAEQQTVLDNLLARVAALEAA